MTAGDCSPRQLCWLLSPTLVFLIFTLIKLITNKFSQIPKTASFFRLVKK